MREKIILAPGANGNELVKSLALHGVNSFGLRICSAGELARLALIRVGASVNEEFISAREETTLIAEAVKDEDYFSYVNKEHDSTGNPGDKEKGHIKYSDIREIAAAIRRMRSLATEADEEEQIERVMSEGEFSEKNKALVSVYKKYKALLKKNKLIDSVAVIRKAISKCSISDAKLMTLKEYPLTPLEEALIQKLSGGKHNRSSLEELFGIKEAGIKTDGIKKCYGAPNEVETILEDIYKNKSLDSCTVAVTDPKTYGQLFFDYACYYDLPVTFGCGVPIINSNPAKLLASYYNWMTSGFFGKSALKAMLSNPAFDIYKLNELCREVCENFESHKYDEILLGLRLTNDRAVNNKRLANFKKAVAVEEAGCDKKNKNKAESFILKKQSIPFLEFMAKELALPAEEFIKKYAYIRKGSDTNTRDLLMRLDQAAVNAISDELKIMRAAGADMTDEELIPEILKLTISEGTSEAGKLFVTDIDGAMSTVRGNLYIAGLSASKYPGSPRENYLLLDTDLELFGKEETKQLTSNGIIKRKHENLMALVRLASGLGSHVNVSFAGLNVSELKKDNASSLIYELYYKEHGENVTLEELKKHIKKVKYFEPKISLTRQVGEAYISERKVLPKPVAETKK